VEVNYKYQSLKSGHLLKANTDMAKERKGDERNMKNTGVMF
jgi:hypothetical protein